jgi:hypothetical protein
LNIALTKISGSWQRLTLGGWIIAALFLIAYNSSRLMVLLSPPITARSMEVKLASQKWWQLQDKISHGSKENLEAMDLDMAFLGTSTNAGGIKPKSPDISSAKVDNGQQTKIQLPILSGILHNTDIHGRASALAIIDGHRLKESDKIQGFKIQKIKDDGVVVTRNGQRWFLSAPNVPYNRIHVSGVKSDDTKVSTQSLK